MVLGKDSRKQRDEKNPGLKPLRKGTGVSVYPGSHQQALNGWRGTSGFKL